MPNSEPPEEDTEHNRESFAPRGEIVQRPRACLVVMSGPTMGEVHRLKVGEAVIGRTGGVELRFKEAGMSRRHARVVVERSRTQIEDLQSANGTFVNGTEIKGAVALADGDRIQVGSVQLRFTYADTAEETFQRQMYNAALRDALTGTFNRTYLLERLTSELAFALRHRSSLALIVFDVDGFRKINELHGHPAGDQVLMQIVRRVQWTVRTEDVLGRSAGDEFWVICRGVPNDGVMQLAERLRVVVHAQKFDLGGKSTNITITLGVAVTPPLAVSTAVQLVDAGARALAQAKHAGRNRAHAVSADLSEDEPVTMRWSGDVPPPSRRGG